MRAPRMLSFLFVCCCVLAARTASATGFEKPVVLSGKYGGVAGAAVSSASGAESLMFNPAGLGGTRWNVEFQLAGSPFISRKSGPVLPDPSSPTRGADAGSAPGFAFPGGVFVAARARDRLGIGIGYFAVAGGGGSYGDVDFGPGFTVRPELSGGLAMNELAFGAGYQVTRALRLGAAWRVTFVRAEASAAAVIPGPDVASPTLYALEFTDLSGISAGGFRAGAQYEPPGGSWGLGASFRSGIEWTARGQSSARAQVAGDAAVRMIAGGSVKLHAPLPWQASAGGHWAIRREVRMFGQYELTNSSDVDELHYSGVPIGGLDPAALTSPVKWRDMHTFRVGVEYATRSAAWRAGYSVSTQVTRTDRANFFGVPPGVSQTVTLGAGRNFLRDTVGLDAALDLSRDVGTARGSTEPGFLDGEYSLWAATFHGSVAYRF